jgi:dTDP-4-amino-4,6-dideoxygalactose transaminase
VSSSFIPFIDLRPREESADIRAAIDRVLARGWFVLGPEVEAFEAEFAAASGARHAVAVASGTDAITLLLKASGIGPGDEVIVPALTAAYTALAVVSAGARPVFADIDPDRLTLDAAACGAAVTSRTRAIVPVHLYGQPADTAAIRAVANRHGLPLIEDCCQAHLATCAGVPVGTRSAGGAFSFYPTKNLGAFGDGGAVITNDPAIAGRVRLLRSGGQAERYRHVEAGINSRLDEIQAAVLRVKLRLLHGQTARRRALAAEYRRHLGDSPRAIPECDTGHVYHLFPVRSAERDGLQEHLRQANVETFIHYPFALSDQGAFAPFAPSLCPVATRVAGEVLSLPLHPRLDEADVARIAEAAATFQRTRVPA